MDYGKLLMDICLEQAEDYRSDPKAYMAKARLADDLGCTLGEAQEILESCND